MILASLGSVHPVFSSLSFSSFDKGAQFDPSLLYCLYVRLVTCKQILAENLLPPVNNKNLLPTLHGDQAS